MKTYFTVILVSFTSLSHSLPKSGRRSDGLSHHTVQRKELKYSAPPRGRGGGRTNLEGNHFEPTAHHFIPTAPSVYAQSRSSNHHIVQYEAVSTTATHPTTIQPMVFSPMLDNARDQLNMSRIDQEDLVSEICKFSHHSLCDLFRPKSPISQTKPKIEPQNYDLKIREEHPDPKTEEEKQRFKYRHNYPYRRQPKPGDFGLRRSTVNYVPVTTESVGYHGQFGYQPAPTEQPRYKEKFGFHPESPVYSEPQNYPEHFGPHPATTQRPRYQEGVVHYPIQTESPPNIAGPFVTVQKESENITDIARQPKQADDIFVDYGSDSRLNEVRVLPPEEFRHLLAQVDGIDRKDDSNADSVASESRRRPRQSKFRGVPGTAGRDFPTLGSIPMTSFSCIGTKAGFYADIEANCQVYHYCHFDGRQDSFLCSNGTVFNQKVFTCDWWYNVNCAASEDLYSLNDNLYKDGSSLFGESVGGNGNDFDLSKLQSLLKRNTLEIDNLLSSSSKRDLLNSPLRSSLSLDSSLPLSLLRSSTKLENSISKKSGPSGKSLRFSDITAARFLEPEVKSASSPLGKDDITVSYESRPSGGFSVFYTVPKEPLEASKVDKIKDLIQSINKKTLLKENLKNSINDYEDDYYEDDDYESDYYVEDTLTNLKTLKNPPDLSDDYYDPGPPASYYDDIPEYIGEEDDEYNDYDYDYEEDYEEDYDDDYYDVAEDRMMIESSTMNPMVLSPTIQQLNALTHKQLGNNYLKKRKLSRKKKKKSIERRMDTQGQIERTPTEEDQAKGNIYEQTTKRSFKPNTHRTVQITPSSSVPVASSNTNQNKDGFLGLFATVSNEPKFSKETTTAPLFLGNIDIEDLRKFQQFQEISGKSDDFQKYMQLQNTVDARERENKKRVSRKQVDQSHSGFRNKSVQKQNRRVSQPPVDDSEQKIEALQMLVSSNIQNSLENQKQLYMRQRGLNHQQMKNQMSLARPYAENLNIYNNQVEKPPQPPINNGQLQNGMPFLLQDPSQYKSQVIKINQPNHGFASYPSNTPNPINNLQSTLPFLDTPNIQPMNTKMAQSQNGVQPQLNHYTLQSQFKPQAKENDNAFVFKDNSHKSTNQQQQSLYNFNQIQPNYSYMPQQENPSVTQINNFNNYNKNGVQPIPIADSNLNQNLFNPFTKLENTNFWESRTNSIQPSSYSHNMNLGNSMPDQNIQSITAQNNEQRRAGQETSNYHKDSYGFSQLVNGKSSGYDNNMFSIKDLDTQLKKAREEQKILQVQLNQLKNSGISPTLNGQTPKQSFLHLPVNQPSFNVGNTPRPKVSSNNAFNNPYQTQKYDDTRSNYPRKLSGFPMNFEDMINTGLSLAQQKKENSFENPPYHSLQAVIPRNLIPSSPTQWKSQQFPQTSPKKQAFSNFQSGVHLSNSQNTHKKQQKTNFNPSKLISQNILESKLSQETLHDNFLGNKDISSNVIDTDQIHIIGPNCYVMTNVGFKSIGKAPYCSQTQTSEVSGKKINSKKSFSSSGSIWDSLTSIPLVNNFAKTIGI